MFLWNTLISFNVLAPGAGKGTGFQHFYLEVKVSFRQLHVPTEF